MISFDKAAAEGNLRLSCLVLALIGALFAGCSSSTSPGLEADGLEYVTPEAGHVRP